MPTKDQRKQTELIDNILYRTNDPTLKDLIEVMYLGMKERYREGLPIESVLDTESYLKEHNVFRQEIGKQPADTEEVMKLSILHECAGSKFIDWLQED